jgi:DNA invertase Pin-like site-specific DNA recombinase
MAPADARKLLDLAAQAGADPVWLDRIGDQLLDDTLELAELRRHLDRRVREAIATARRIRRLRDRGVKPRAIAARTGISIATVYRRLREKSTAV